MSEAPGLRDFLGENPLNNWGKWGDDDEVGALNYLGAAEVLAAAAEVRTGQVFTLQIQMGRSEPPGDPIWPGGGRTPFCKHMVIDESSWDGPDAWDAPGGMHYADDAAEMFLQGSTQYDALGHPWYDGKLWNGYDARSTIGGLEKASILPIAERGVVGRAVLIDMARHRGKDWLDPGETISIDELVQAAETQGSPIRKRDIVCIRTGWLDRYYRMNDLAAFERDMAVGEPGLAYSPELVAWFKDMEIPNLVTDTLANETTFDASGIMLPLHAALIRNLGVSFTEIVWLEDLAKACAEDGRWTFMYTAAPLKVVRGAGAPVNPVAIR